ncbi:argininosuccinate lyase [Desulfitobacterium hafniense]|uniref:Argininosuccinate lyase n=5 Tax=root TaxID=1 RepID=ARLY_DESHY|nr:argininosuccinate lyase [Desulfitobacterium hafniense]B8FWX3.1 RecName: Full=Argininosuccinate lyase; Short=ASAL; AltName: Full=Arginosuccinase [Desulfitobacterium hafniense DCB-2]Q24ZG7.1 RecName: Full=Argininosuccinate lyase; Short=ASAL; AltName: Full=Arginosuccinase [Desulfitobacterium hafniense Y51]ACL18859.1 argininosuccinate lyase [Desulfitobacterium hafniense DCB-2]EHL08814.1 argininosuccinate lyase [Desulfitobacterium hafniense DP7]KTE89179.1 argininosuccinate lyase [Desulfitobacter
MKLWGGRFEKSTDALVEDFHSSISFDQRLYKQDIQGSIAHARMLGEIGVLTSAEAQQIIEGLKGILTDIREGKIQFEIGAEDIHMNVEKLLTERVGTVGKKVHTGRSRNDQVALDLRLFLREEIDHTQELLIALLRTVLDLAKEHQETYMPGYTHLQKAQPISFAHHMMAYAQMFLRDLGRLKDTRQRLNVSPLGSGALAGTTFPLEREMVAQELGFDGITWNSLDGVSDRDFALEFLSAASILMMHLSRLCEELVLWSTGEFQFVIMDDGYSTGSSIMPQKKNPDVAELVRGKTGRVYGDLVALLTVMKGLPLAYNKDMQEDKEQVFDAVDTIQKSLLVVEPMLRTMKVNKKAMAEGAKGGFTNATDLADYLAKKNVPFREAHEIVGKLVLYCSKRGCGLEDLTLKEFQEHSDVFAEDLFESIGIEYCVRQRHIPGGPSPESVAQAILWTEHILEQFTGG